MTIERERRQREALGIPHDAERVLVFSESSHWDTNWLSTSEEYFEARLLPILTKVIRALEAHPGRVYCIESLFFLKLFWERHPHLQDRLRALVLRGQLKISSSSLTTPDTLLPHAEAILRDFHLGQEWLRKVGLPVAPTTAYFPDNFGHSPHLPSLMRAVGVDAVALTRIDGMYFLAADFRKKSAFPLKGSTAELLQRELRTLDFVWRDDDGAEVLCHWNAFTYFQGDMLGHAGIIRWNGHVVGIPWATRGHVARRIEGFVRQLSAVTRTPYMLCPIGMDFNDPIERLPELLERYNRERYPVTGVWAALAGLDDYFDLVRTRRDDLPVLSIDPNPYWMGFYASRPDLKQRATRVARTLVLSESLSALSPRCENVETSLRDGWRHLVLLNHHDAITGTSPDRVCDEEQRVWLDAAEVSAKRALSLALSGCEVREGAPEDGAPPSQGIRWEHDGRAVHVATEHYRLAFSIEKGGCLTSFVAHGKEQLRGLGLDLVGHADEGGLWRLGHEYRGGRFKVVDRASLRPADVSVETGQGEVAIAALCRVGGETFKRVVTCRAHEPFLRVRTEGVCARRLTVTCTSELAFVPDRLSMDTVGGTIERPCRRLYSPTFWPVPSLLSLGGEGQGLHVGFEAPSAVSVSPEGVLEWIVARNATKERAFRLLPVLAHPIGGTHFDLQTHEAAFFATPCVEAPPDLVRGMHEGWLPEEWRRITARAGASFRCDDAQVTFTATKRADVGNGIIVRLWSPPRPERVVRVWVASRAIHAASRCDARERDLEPLHVESGRAVVPLASRLTSVRLVV